MTSRCRHNPVHCVLPPYILEHMASHKDAKVRKIALGNAAAAEGFRAVRAAMQAMPAMAANISPQGKKHRLVYDMKKKAFPLPGKLIRSEGDPKSKDDAVNEAYDYSGDTYDFYFKLFGRNSLDDNGMSLISSVHTGDFNGDPLNNAFWDGSQMAYGDGDGMPFNRFTSSLDVVAHELSHGVVSFTSNLIYMGESGALNEHFADAFGIMVHQWKRKVSIAKAKAEDWLIGDELVTPAPTRRALRDLKNPGTAFNGDEFLGDDPQPDHISKKFTGSADRGGVHINSGIPNKAFHLFATALGGNSWDRAGKVWYDLMRQLSANSQFADCARICRQIAAAVDAATGKAADNAWKAVGL